MSDAPHGDGWWVASDGLWYPPEQHPDYGGTAPSAPRADGEGVARSTGLWVAIGIGVAAVVAAAIVVPLVVLGGGDDAPITEASVDLALVAESLGERYYSGIIATDDGLVVAGFEDLETEVATFWRSADGGATLNPVSELDIAGAPYPYQAIETDGGYLAVGELFYAEAGEADPLVLRSSDGVEWAVAANPNLLGGPGYEYFVDVAPAPEGGFVAVRHRLVDDGRTASLWFSDTGRVWAPGGFVGIPRDALIWAIVAVDDGVVAVGSDGVDQPRVWLSVDGRDWREVPARGPLVAPAGAELIDVIATDRGLVAVGRTGAPGAGDPFVVVSGDGEEWTRPALPGGTGTAADDGLFAIVEVGAGLRAYGPVDDGFGIWAVEVD